MVFEGFGRRVALRAAGIFITVFLSASVFAYTQWYLTAALLLLWGIAQTIYLIRFATRSHLEVARFLEAISEDDMSQSFSSLQERGANPALAQAMSRALSRLRAGRSEREERMQYLQVLVDHAPVPLLSVGEDGTVQLLNIAARNLFGTRITEVAAFARYGTAFAAGMQALEPGHSAILKMERTSGALQLKVAATGVASRGLHHHLISLQNIELEMTAQEMAAWQTVIRVMAHEVMNSLTPVSSLARTAHDLVQEALQKVPETDASAATLRDTLEALETLARRSEGLLHFVENHRRLTRRLETQPEITSVRRLFARLQRLLGQDLAARNIEMRTSIEPETLEITVDPALLDQALINLVRNAIEALRERSNGLITLSASRDADGHVTIAVADNGPGIAPDLREKVFVPFFTTKRQGSGIGLTVVKQIATAHGAAVGLSEASGSGTVVSLRF